MVAALEYIFLMAFVPFVMSHLHCLQPPVKNLPDSCTIGNLAILSYSHGMPSTNSSGCNSTVPERFLFVQPKLHLSYISGQYENSKLLLLAFDESFTPNRLFWAESNVSVSRNGTLIFPGKNSTLRSYSSVQADKVHVKKLVFLIFVEKPGFLNQSFVIYENDYNNLNLTNLLSRNLYSGVTICGPVAAIRLLVYDASQNPQFPAPRPHQPMYPTIHPQWTYQPTSHPNQTQRPPRYQPSYPSQSFPSNSSKSGPVGRGSGVCFKSNFITFFLAFFIAKISW